MELGKPDNQDFPKKEGFELVCDRMVANTMFKTTNSRKVTSDSQLTYN